MPAPVAGIHVFLRAAKTWTAGTPGAKTRFALLAGHDGSIGSMLQAKDVETRPDQRQTAFRLAQRRVFRRLCETGLCRARTGDALVGDCRRRYRPPFRAVEDAVAAAGRGAAAGTGHAGA